MLRTIVLYGVGAEAQLAALQDLAASLAPDGGRAFKFFEQPDEADPIRRTMARLVQYADVDASETNRTFVISIGHPMTDSAEMGATPTVLSAQLEDLPAGLAWPWCVIYLGDPTATNAETAVCAAISAKSVPVLHVDVDGVHDEITEAIIDGLMSWLE